jgi:hypothetical protein
MLSNLPLIFLGDHHGNWSDLFYLIDKNNISNCNLISVGDSGIGFEYKTRQLQTINRLNKVFEEKNIYFKAIRGNHDDPAYFKGDDRIALKHFELIEDYSVWEYNSKSIQFIGGAVSIDRTGRAPNVSYWLDEGVIFNKNACKKVDILVTHTAPSVCFPQSFNEMVYGWAREDAYLIEDLNDERSVMNEILKLCDPEYHFYGHFHSSWSEQINGCRHRLLAINELYEFNN